MHLCFGEPFMCRTPLRVAGDEMHLVTRFRQRVRYFLDTDVPGIVGIPDLADPHRRCQLTGRQAGSFAPRSETNASLNDIHKLTGVAAAKRALRGTLPKMATGHRCASPVW